MQKSEFLEGVQKFLRNEPLIDIDSPRCKFTEKNFKSSMKILAIPDVDEDWKDIYEDKEMIIAQQAVFIRDGFRKSTSSGWSVEKTQKIVKIQAEIVYENMLKTNIELHIKKLEEIIMKAKSRMLTEIKLKESLKEKYALCKNTMPDTTQLEILRGKCVRVLQTGNTDS